MFLFLDQLIIYNHSSFQALQILTFCVEFVSLKVCNPQIYSANFERDQAEGQIFIKKQLTRTAQEETKTNTGFHISHRSQLLSPSTLKATDTTMCFRIRV